MNDHRYFVFKERERAAEKLDWLRSDRETAAYRTLSPAQQELFLRLAKSLAEYVEILSEIIGPMVFTEGDNCPAPSCPGVLLYDPGEQMTREEPGYTACIYCESCGAEFNPDPSLLERDLPDPDALCDIMREEYPG